MRDAFPPHVPPQLTLVILDYSCPSQSNENYQEMASQTSNRLAFRETDEADNATATYIYSEQDATSSKRALGGRVDMMVGGDFVIPFCSLGTRQSRTRE